MTPTSAPARRRARLPLDALLQAVLKDADSGILVLDGAGRVRALNPAAERLLLVSAVDVRGRSASDLVRTVVAGDDPVADALRGETVERDTVIAQADGAEIPVSLRIARVGRPAWMVVTLRDLTQTRRMQEELRRNERLATLGQLSAGVAHEIRNPLAGIGTSAQVLLRRFEPRDERARFVQVILDEVDRLDRIVTHLLQYARPRVPQLQPEGLAPCVQQVCERETERFRKAGVEVEIQAAPRLVPVWIDADLVTQVILNVTINAVDAMPAGGRLRYEIRRVRRRRAPRGPGRRADDRRAADRRADDRRADDHGGPERRNGDLRAARGSQEWIEYQQIRVIDTGQGIARAALGKLFDPFFSTKPRGTGLGLSICHTIMQEHGGTIEIASREGRGTTVLLGFPVEKRHGERREPSRSPGRTLPTHRR